MPLLKLLNIHRPGLQRLGTLYGVSRTLQMQRHSTLRLFTSNASRSLLPATFLSPSNNHHVLSRRNKNIYHKYAKYDGQKIPGRIGKAWIYFLCTIFTLGICTETWVLVLLISVVPLIVAMNCLIVENEFLAPQWCVQRWSALFSNSDVGQLV